MALALRGGGHPACGRRVATAAAAVLLCALLAAAGASPEEEVFSHTAVPIMAAVEEPVPEPRPTEPPTGPPREPAPALTSLPTLEATLPGPPVDVSGPEGTDALLTVDEPDYPDAALAACICMALYDPVCAQLITSGESGSTSREARSFGNSCLAMCAGASTILHDGECGEQSILQTDSTSVSPPGMKPPGTHKPCSPRAATGAATGSCISACSCAHFPAHQLTGLDDDKKKEEEPKKEEPKKQDKDKDDKPKLQLPPLSAITSAALTEFERSGPATITGLVNVLNLASSMIPADPQSADLTSLQPFADQGLASNTLRIAGMCVCLAVPVLLAGRWAVLICLMPLRVLSLLLLAGNKR